MQKEIKYTGFSENPSDYVSPDGDLASVVGMVPEDEAVKPIQQPAVMFGLPSEEGVVYSVVFIHKNAGYTHYIILREVQSSNIKEYYWLGDIPAYVLDGQQDFDQAYLICSFSNTTVYELNALGNTLLILTASGIEYYLWKAGNYNSLGQNMPVTYLSFGLTGNIATETKEQTFNDLLEKVIYFPIIEHEWYKYDNYIFRRDEEKNIVTDGVLPHVNRFISKQINENNKFIFPFFVRYAYRLVDETLVMHSVPLLMTTDTSAWTPRCDVIKADAYALGSDGEVNTYVNAVMKLRCIAYDLNYAAYIPGNLEDWKDIIKSVDIFVSLPIYTYNQAGKVTGFFNSENDYIDYGGTRTRFNGYTIGRVSQLTPANYNKWTSADYAPAMNCELYIKEVALPTSLEFSRNTHRAFILPYHSSSKLQEDISAVHDFYLLKSIPIEELSTQRTKITLTENYLANLSTKERMSDGSTEGSKIIAKNSFVYNQRINLSGIIVEVPNPYTPASYSPYANNLYAEYEIYVVIEEGDRQIVVKSPNVSTPYTNFSLAYLNSPFIYFYYPNPNAKRVIICKISEGTRTYFEFPLVRHDFMNGAVFYKGWTPTYTPSLSEPVPSNDRTLPLPNKLYTSEVANPFVFTTKGIQTVGVGTILGVRPIVKAMSTSQYGQHDLYVFSTDGVWSLEVDSEGYLHHSHLATPDIVLADGSSITQVDGAVLFATDRGIMLISGSESVCISEMLNSSAPFRPIGSAAADDLLPGLRNVAGSLLEEIQMDTFRNFVTDCRMSYDYPHQRVIVYSPSHDYAYVYSLKSKQWGMMPSKILSTPLNYPAALAMVTDDNGSRWLVDYSKNKVSAGVIQVEQGLIITRPLKLDYPDVLKTVDTVIQRGRFQKGHVKSILYGSRDLQHWQLVWSSVDHYLRGFSGTPYKYFRLALLCNLEEGEDLLGCTVQFTPRLTDQLR